MALTKAHNRMIAGASVNVIDYGADPTGVTDSTAAINAAIAANSAAVYFPAGTFLISGTINAAAKKRIYGDGWRSTTIQTSGDNGGDPFIVGPQEMEGLYIVGDSNQGTGVQLGPKGSFTGHVHWQNLRITGFNLGMQVYNIYTTLFTKVDIVYNTNGMQIGDDTGSGANGYFTTFQMDSCLLGYGEGYGIWAYARQGVFIWQMDNCVVEGFGTGTEFFGTWSNSSTYDSGHCVIYSNKRWMANATTVAGEQPGVSSKWDEQLAIAQIQTSNSRLDAYGLYIESKPGTPAIATESSVAASAHYNINEPFFNGTGGIYIGTQAGYTRISGGRGGSAKDAYLWQVNNANQYVLLDAGANVTLSDANTNMTRHTRIAHDQITTPIIKIGRGANPSINEGMTMTRHWRKAVNGTVINAGATVTVITDEAENAITQAGTVAHAMITGDYQPNIICNVTPATTGSANYFCVHLHNLSGSPITLGANAVVNVHLIQHTGTTL